MPSINNENVECVDNGPTANIGTHNPSSVEALPPKPKKTEQNQLHGEHFTKIEGGDFEDPKSKCNYCSKLFSCHCKRLGTLMSAKYCIFKPPNLH
jgi:hypothetical protein